MIPANSKLLSPNASLLAVERALAEAAAGWALRFGLGSQLSLFEAATTALLQPTPDGVGAASADPAELCRALERDHVQRYGTPALEVERADDCARVATFTSDNHLVAYQADWERRLTRLARRHPARLRVAGLSPEEVRDALTLHLVEVLRADPEVQLAYCRPGKPWGFAVIQEQLRSLRRQFRLGAEPTDFGSVAVAERGLTQEERWLDLEADACRELASLRAQQGLSQPQRRWFSALRLAAHCGEFFERSDRLNLSAASRLLGKDRSSALRAYRELQSQFQRELERVL